MIQHQVKVAVSIAALGLAVALGSVLPASASQRSSVTHLTTSSPTMSSGANPNSKLCVALQSEESVSARVAGAMTSAFVAGKFAKAKTILLSAVRIGVKSVESVLSPLKSSPAKVQRAFRVLVKFETSLQTQLKRAKGMHQLETAFTAAGSNSQLSSAGAIVSKYVVSQCGSLAK